MPAPYTCISMATGGVRRIIRRNVRLRLSPRYHREFYLVVQSRKTHVRLGTVFFSPAQVIMTETMPPLHKAVIPLISPQENLFMKCLLWLFLLSKYHLRVLVRIRDGSYIFCMWTILDICANTQLLLPAFNWCSKWLCINCENASTMVKNSWNGSDICRFFHKIRSWWFGTLTLLRCNIGGREMEGAEGIYLNIALIMTLKFTKEPQFIKPVFTMNLKLSHPALPGLEKIPRNL